MPIQALSFHPWHREVRLAHQNEVAIFVPALMLGTISLSFFLASVFGKKQYAAVYENIAIRWGSLTAIGLLLPMSPWLGIAAAVVAVIVWRKYPPKRIFGGLAPAGLYLEPDR